MTQFANTFRPQTPVGATLQNLSQALFSGRASPMDNAGLALRRAQTDKASAETAGIQLENQQMRDRARMIKDPNAMNSVASAMSNVPVSDVNFLNEVMSDGVQGPINMGRGQQQQVGSIIGGLRGLPMMTGKTNLEQFQNSVGSGMENSRVADALSGGMPLAELQSALKGNPTYNVSGGIGFRPHGGAEDITVTDPQVALAEQRRGAANKYNAEAQAEGTPGKFKPADAKLIQSSLAVMFKGQNFDLENDPSALQAISAADIRAQEYFNSPNSPTFGDHGKSAEMAFNDVMSTGTPYDDGAGLFNLEDAATVNLDQLQPLLFGGTNDTGVASAIGQPIPEGGNELNGLTELPSPAGLEEGSEAIDDDTGKVTHILQNGKWLPVS